MVTSQTVYGFYTVYELDRLKSVESHYRPGRSKKKKRYNAVFCMADTETSKSDDFDENGHRINRVVCWSVALRYRGRNVFCLYGRRPSELCSFLLDMHRHMTGTHTIIYWHNLSYDWQFIRKFCFSAWGHPVEQLNTKSHYPVNIEFSNGIIFRDSLILAQVGLAKWGEQMQVEHGKAVDNWDYDAIRTQQTPLTDEELIYIYDDVLCGVECLDALMNRLDKKQWTMPWTATGIVRELTRKTGKEHHAHDDYLKQTFDYSGYLQCEQTYHGGYTHANRYKVGKVQRGEIMAFDFASSYPFCMISEKFPAEKFMRIPDSSVDGILRYQDDFAFLFRFIAFDIKLSDPLFPMPYLQGSKCVRSINAVFDNGRILEADMIEIYLTEVDLAILRDQYTWSRHVCTDVMFAHKEYLPKWFSCLVFDLYRQKCTLKNGDKTEYALSKSRVNSLYGMSVQRLIKDKIEEQYELNDYITVELEDPEEEYLKEIKKRGHVLPYQIGVWVTAYACRNLFRLGACFDTWLYSDTDSAYGLGVDKDKIAKYNGEVLRKLRAAGFDDIEYEGKTFRLGEAALDGVYAEFVTLGAKRYATRDAETRKLKITVAGVPKDGVEALHDDIDKFKKGLIFKGKDSGKKQHFYGYVNDIYIDQNGDEIGDYVDLDPCDYLLDDIFSIDRILNDDIGVPIYG